MHPRRGPVDPSRSEPWEEIQAKAHLPEIQELIRREIYRGTIHVLPLPDGGLRIIPNPDRPLAQRVAVSPHVWGGRSGLSPGPPPH
jgi:hypothetical protein